MKPNVRLRSNLADWEVGDALSAEGVGDDDEGVTGVNVQTLRSVVNMGVSSDATA